jgi:hypothetical protein
MARGISKRTGKRRAAAGLVRANVRRPAGNGWRTIYEKNSDEAGMQGDATEEALDKLAADSAVLLDGSRVGRRPLRAHRPPLWAASPPSSFFVIQPGTGVPLQRFWIPVHAAITAFILLSLFMTWKDRKVRRLLLAGLVSYIVMRVWSFLYFIPEHQVLRGTHQRGEESRQLIHIQSSPRGSLAGQ